MVQNYPIMRVFNPPFLLLFLLFHIQSLFGQGCIPDDITLRDQSEINAFPKKHPGCHVIDGNLTIGERMNRDDVFNLDSLYLLEEVAENLTIWGRSSLENVKGLKNLQYVGGAFRIIGDQRTPCPLSSLTGLENLRSAGGIELIFLVNLTDINALAGLTTIRGDIKFSLLPRLDNIAGLTNITSIGGSLSILGTNTLQRLDPLAHLTAIGGNLDISLNGNLQTLSGLQNISEINGYLNIFQNPRLTSIDSIYHIDPSGIRSTYPAYKDINIYQNPNLTSCSVSNLCSALQLAGTSFHIEANGPDCGSKQDLSNGCNPGYERCPEGDLIIHTQKDLRDFAVHYPDCEVIEGDLIIDESIPLTISHLRDLQKLKTVKGNLKVTNTTLLADLYALDHIEQIGGNIIISSNKGLQGIFNLRQIAVSGNLYIAKNPNLNSLSGLSQIRNISGDFTIYKNEKLPNLMGVEALSEVLGAMRISNIPLLTDLKEFENLRKVEGYLSIDSNAILNSLEAIQTIDLSALKSKDTRYNDLEIRNNPMLTNCALDSICYRLIKNDISIEIADNGPGCTDNATVELKCTEGISCGARGITLRTQEQIDNFAYSYAKCDKIIGDLTIRESRDGDIYNLDGLSVLTSIGGSLIIESNNNLNDLKGLRNIQRVGGRILIKSNEQLEHLHGLHHIQKIGESLEITTNPSLLTLQSGLDDLQEIGGGLSINNNPAMLHLKGLEALKRIRLGLSISSMQNLVNLSGLEGLNFLGWNIFIKNTPSLKNLKGLDNLTQLNGQLIFSNTNNLESFDGLTNLEVIKGNLKILGLTKLTKLIGLQKLDSIYGEFEVRSCPKLTDLDELNNLKYVGKSFTLINGNLRLEHIRGFENLRFIGGTFRIHSSNLTLLSGFDKLKHIKGRLEIANNLLLDRLEGFNGLNRVDDNIIISANNALSQPNRLTISGFNGLKSLNKKFQIIDNPGLMKIEGFNGLEVLDHLQIHNNHQLDKINGFHEAKNIRNNLEITENEIRQFDAFDKLDSINKSLILKGRVGLESRNGFGSLRKISGGLEVKETELKHLGGLESLESVNGTISILKNNNLRDFQGMGALKETGSNIEITENNALVSLKGLENLEYYKGTFTISKNNNLQFISAINQLKLRVKGSGSINKIKLTSNRKLTVCGIPLLCRLLSLSAANLTVGGNGPGCNTKTDVIEICYPGTCVIPEMKTQQDIDEFPINYPDCKAIFGAVKVTNVTFEHHITNLDGLNQIEEIYGNLVIYTGTTLESLEGLSNLRKVTGSIWIIAEGYDYGEILALKNLKGLEKLKEIGGSLYIRKKEYINRSNISFEGLEHLEHIRGSLVLTGSYNNCRGLGSLKTIGGNLHLYGYRTDSEYGCHLESFEGLDALDTIYGGILISDQHSSLGSFKGLKRLKYIGNGVAAAGQLTGFVGGFEDLTGLENVQYMGGGIKLTFCTKVKSLKGMPPFSKIKGGITLIDLPDLIEITDLKNVTEIEGRLALAGLPHLENLSGLEHLEKVGGSLTIGIDGLGHTNDKLHDLTALSGLKSINGRLTISNNSSLRSLSGLENIDPSSMVQFYSSTGSPGLRITFNPVLSECSIQPICDYLNTDSVGAEIFSNYTGCESADTIKRYCRDTQACFADTIVLDEQDDIDGFSAAFPTCHTFFSHILISEKEKGNINNLRGLHSIHSIRGDLIIRGNSGLKSLEGLDSLFYLMGDLLIQNNEQLSSLNGLEGIDTLNHNFVLDSNASLINFRGLERLTHIHGRFEVHKNNKLVNFEHLDSLKSIGSEFSITYNASLESFEGLKRLNHLKVHNFLSALIIKYNNSLTSLTGLENLDYTDFKNAEITNNPMLSDCAISNLCHDLDILKVFPIKLDSNAPSCNSRKAIANSCLTIGVDECLTGGVHFETQKQIDEFPKKYPGCKTILGQVQIGYSARNFIFNLDSLSPIEHIRGGLWIGTNSLSYTLIDSITGLRNLQSIHGRLEIKGNAKIKDLKGLDALKSVHGDIVIYNNRALKSISSLASIDPSTIKRSGNNPGLTIVKNPQLRDCSINPICEYLRLPSSKLSISANAGTCKDRDEVKIACGDTICSSPGIFTSQKQIDQFPQASGKCRAIEGDLIIMEDTPGDIRNLDGLIHLTTVTGSIIIRGNLRLQSLEGLGNIPSIGGDFILSKNYSLTTLDGLNKLHTINGRLQIDNNHLLNDITLLNQINPKALQSSDQQHCDVEIEDNYGLSDCQLDIFCTLIQSADKTLCLADNGAQCSDLREVTKSCQDNGCRIDGLTISSDQDVDHFIQEYKGCEVVIDGDLIIRDKVTDIGGLDIIREITGDLQVTVPYRLKSVSGFNQLTRIGGNLLISKTSIDTLKGFDQLRRIGRSFSLESNPELKTIGGFNRLETIGQHLQLFNHPLIDKIEGFSALTTIGGDLNIWLFLGEQIRGMQNLQTIGGRLTIENSTPQNLSDYIPVGSLDSIKNGIRFAFTRFKDLSGLDQIGYIRGGITITNNNSLRDISALNPLNPKLIRSEGPYDLSIQDNENLTTCNTSFVCKMLSDPDARVRVHSNGIDCRHNAQIKCSRLLISGRVFYDLNRNKKQDPGEPGIPNVWLESKPGGARMLSGRNGEYHVESFKGTIQSLGFSPAQNWSASSDSTTYHIEPDPIEDTLSYSFGMMPSSDFHAGSINLSSYLTQCDKTVDFALEIRNTGSSPEKVRLLLRYDSLVTFHSSIPVPDDIQAGSRTLIWHMNSLSPFEQNQVSIRMNMPDDLQENKTLSFSTYLERDSAGSYVPLDSFEYRPVLLCTSSTNDKLVTPPGEGVTHIIPQGIPLTYTLRFHNEGATLVHDIVLVDKLDPKLDIHSLKVLNSSADYYLSLHDSTAEVVFEGIDLPPMSTHPREGRGFITFEVSPIPGLTEGDVIENDARFYFDTDPLIRTNTVFNTLGAKGGIWTNNPIVGSMLHLAPNPANTVIRAWATDGSNVQITGIYDLSGRPFLSIPGREADVRHLKNGIYVVHLQTSRRTEFVKLIIHH